MTLVRLIYASRLTEAHRGENIMDILTAARKNNHRLCISGMLVYGSEMFLQILEGGRDAVNLIYAKILSDERHKDQVILSYTDISERQFEEWSMGLVTLTAAKRDLLKKYAAQGDFDPFSLSGESALKTLLALKADVKS